jgi:enoyl-CoA hydratase/carnithine racemase
MSAFLNSAREGAVLILTMNQPETRNALTGNTAVDEFLAKCAEIAADTSIRAVILTGAGPVFSSGGNLKDMQKYFTRRPSADVVIEEYRSGIQRLPKALLALDVPLIAAVNGAAIGAGLDLACMCDIRIAANTAVFAESFIKVGLIPGDGGAWLLPRVVGFSKASEMAFTGDRLNADEALACGLVSRVVESDQLMAEARRIAARIVVNPPVVLRLTKRLLREAQKGSLEASLELAAGYQATAHQTAEHEEAVRAFIEKRKPNFAA